jgi:uncharacterized membrane protein
MEWLAQVFSLVCGQNPTHTWGPAGVILPCCQRCTGLYAGAAAAVLLQLLLQPRPTARFLQLHGLFLLQMAPFGLHWLPQGPLVRTLTGLLFGYGVVAFLFCLPRARWPNQKMAAEGRARTPLRAVVTDYGTLQGARSRVRALPHSAPEAPSRRRQAAVYWCAVGASVLLLPVWASWGGALLAKALGLVCFAGLLALAALVVVNLVLVVAWAAGRLGWHRSW